MIIKGFDWDDGNWPKCGKHGLAKSQIEYVLQHAEVRVPDPNPDEARFRAVGKTVSGRYVFIVYMYRRFGEDIFIRPISARYMHQKEVTHYEQR